MAPPLPAYHHSAVLTALLLCGLAVLLVLALTARDLQQPPGFTVGSRLAFGFGAAGGRRDAARGRAAPGMTGNGYFQSLGKCGQLCYFWTTGHGSWFRGARAWRV